MQEAFQVCKALESEARWLVSPDDLHSGSEDILSDLTPTCAGRALGFGLLYSPSNGGRDALATDILERNGDHELLAGLAHLYVFGFIGLRTSSVLFCLLFP